ncbi:unnamed protein product [Brassica oleracea]
MLKRNKNDNWSGLPERSISEILIENELKRTTINPRSCSGKDKALLRLLSSEGNVLGSCWSSNQRLLNCGNTKFITSLECLVLFVAKEKRRYLRSCSGKDKAFLHLLEL